MTETTHLQQLRRRGKSYEPLPACGARAGNTSTVTFEVTCPKCLVSKRMKQARTEAEAWLSAT